MDECIDMAAETAHLHRSTKQLLLMKITTMPDFKKSRKGGHKAMDDHPVLRNPALRMLLEDAHENMDVEYSQN